MLDTTSYILGKKAGGGEEPTGTINITENGITNVKSYATADVNVQPNLESKEITITENTTTLIEPTTGKDGLSSVSVITNVPVGDDWSDIGYSSTPSIITDVHEYSAQIYDTFNPLTQKFENNREITICPLINTSERTRGFDNYFKNCTSLIEVPAIVVNPTTDQTLANMFNNCSKLEYIDLSNFITSNVKTLTNMFYNCSKLKNIDISNFNLGITFFVDNLFYGCSLLENINFGNNLTFEAITSMKNMFQGCKNLNDNTLNTILRLLTTATSYTGTKTLAWLGFTSSNYPASRIQALSNYQDFIDAGWSIGY